MISAVDGPSVVQKAGTWKPRAVVKHPIHAIRRLVTLERTEVQFLEYRLAVVASWPESRRKQAALGAILFRLNGPADAPTSS